jgi:desampylase
VRRQWVRLLRISASATSIKARQHFEALLWTPMRQAGSAVIVNAMLMARGVLDAIIAHAVEAQPRECCGLLIGTRDAIHEAVKSGNLSDDPNRFELDPVVHIQARRSARERELVVNGFYHSHPHSAPVPSPTDLAEAMYEDAVQLIVGRVNEKFEARLYRYSGGNYEALLIDERHFTNDD